MFLSVLLSLSFRPNFNLMFSCWFILTDAGLLWESRGGFQSVEWLRLWRHFSTQSQRAFLSVPVLKAARYFTEEADESVEGILLYIENPEAKNVSLNAIKVLNYYFVLYNLDFCTCLLLDFQLRTHTQTHCHASLKLFLLQSLHALVPSHELMLEYSSLLLQSGKSGFVRN